jgi:hypothetical protein
MTIDGPQRTTCDLGHTHGATKELGQQAVNQARRIGLNACQDGMTDLAGPLAARFRQDLRRHCEEQEDREDNQVHDALKHGGPAGAQRDHAGEDRQRQQDLILQAKAELQRLPERD